MKPVPPQRRQVRLPLGIGTARLAKIDVAVLYRYGLTRKGGKKEFMKSKNAGKSIGAVENGTPRPRMRHVQSTREEVMDPVVWPSASQLSPVTCDSIRQWPWPRPHAKQRPSHSSPDQ